MKNISQASFGQHGYKIVTGAANTTPPADYNIVAVTVLAEASISTETTNTTRFPNMTTVTVPAGVTLYGSWSKVTLASGTVVCYMG